MKILPLFLPLLIALTACGKSSASLSKLPNQGIILAFGDSLTYDTGASPRRDYPSVLAGLTARQVVNAREPYEPWLQANDQRSHPGTITA
ncbi:hypothetical protein [Methylomicrobium agile]|uniref:hypothetical protein n=1 Tax=Methylomicrobium agile TaxID=39774 RepID=UPI0012F6C886|nr:hypothetical protein [Methylomicrobium agile]